MRHVPLAVALVVLAAGCGSASPAPSRLDAALVAGAPITRSDVQSYIDYALSFYAWVYGTGIGAPSHHCAQSAVGGSCGKLRRQVLLRLLEERVVQNYAQAHRIRLTAADRARIAGQVSGILAHDTTVSQLVAQHRITRRFLMTLLERETLVQKVESVVTAGRITGGPEIHIRRIVVLASPGTSPAQTYRQAVRLATDGTPIPQKSVQRVLWMAPFRLEGRIRTALASAATGQFVGPFPDPRGYLVVELLGRGMHRYAKPARLVLEQRLFRTWMDAQLRHTALQCFDASGRSTGCPTQG